MTDETTPLQKLLGEQYDEAIRAAEERGYNMATRDMHNHVQNVMDKGSCWDWSYLEKFPKTKLNTLLNWFASFTYEQSIRENTRDNDHT